MGTTGAPALIADIGGTHARFALVGEQGDILHPMVLRSADYLGPAEAALAYLNAMAGSAPRPERGAFAVASAITGDRLELTNVSWSFSIAQVQERLGLTTFRVINDFTAVALSVQGLAAQDRIQIGGEAPVADAPIAVLGPGTGLGVSGLVPAADGSWVALATEGGHASMAAADEREAQLLEKLRRRFGHVSAERLLSGPGLVNLYGAVAAQKGRAAAYDSPDAITAHGQDGSCDVCRETLDTFFAMLGGFAGNLALSYGARGGVFLAGGILPRLSTALAASAFRSRFEAKGRFRDYLRPIPAWLITHPQPAFIGLAALVK